MNDVNNDSTDTNSTDETTEVSTETTTEGGEVVAAPTNETPAEKKSRIGGRQRALKEDMDLLDAAIKAASEKDQNGVVRQSAVVEALNALHASFTTLRTPKVKGQRDGAVRVLRPYFVGWKADGTRQAFTAKPADVEFTKIDGPYSSRQTALMLVDLGYIPAAPSTEA